MGGAVRDERPVLLRRVAVQQLRHEDEVEAALAEARLVRPGVPGVERAPARVLERRRVHLGPDLLSHDVVTGNRAKALVENWLKGSGGIIIP